jgi:hypothetical protein
MCTWFVSRTNVFRACFPATSAHRYWQRVFRRYPGRVVLVIVEQFPAVPMSWAVYNHANYATEEFETWWREAHLHSVALRHIVSYPDVQGHPFLLSAGDADEVLQGSTHDALQWVYGVGFFGWSCSLLLEGIIANGELPNQASAVCVCVCVWGDLFAMLAPHLPSSRYRFRRFSAVFARLLPPCTTH